LIATRNGTDRLSKKSMAAKESAGLRVSMSTTAPTAPIAMWFHEFQNRCWPGVPKR
jgi:hypothetical protein